MKIGVCIKSTPDTDARIKVQADGSGIDFAGIKFIISPYDSFALEQGVLTKEKLGSGDVVLYSAGNPEVEKILRDGLALGADSAVLKVIDQGRGINEQQRERIYDMFHSERTHGAGIGLALVRQIIDAHHGRIDIESEQNRGATFVVTLPAHRHAQLPRQSEPRALRSHPPAA